MALAKVLALALATAAAAALALAHFDSTSVGIFLEARSLTGEHYSAKKEALL